jgi:hypothetical protein
MSRPPQRLRHGCPHDGGELLRDVLGQFICEVCGRAWDEESLAPRDDS